MFTAITGRPLKNLVRITQQRRNIILTRDIEAQLNRKPMKPVIVVGGGHAGVEAATGSARSGAQTTIVTPDIYKIGVTSCNPAFGRHRKRYVA